jgi:hypothetical protein
MGISGPNLIGDADGELSAGFGGFGGTPQNIYDGQDKDGKVSGVEVIGATGLPNAEVDPKKPAKTTFRTPPVPQKVFL